MKHILIVDDNIANLIAAKRAISNIYEVTTVSSGAQALGFLEENKPDLILLDINMPDMDGFQVMECIRDNEECSNIPIVFLTADGDAETESRCLEDGASDFIAKPFVPAVMRSRIARILELEDFRKNLSMRLDETIKEVSDMKSKSLKDVLTGLWNRAYTEEKVDELLQKGASGTLFMMDLDNFKGINDTYGHIEGDDVLKFFAETIQKHVREEDIVCRLGGDEFIAFMKGEESKTAIGNRAAKIISDMCCYFEEKKYDTNSSVSVGIAQYPNDGEDFQALYNAADKALYHVKQNGKNSYHFYSDQNASEKERANTNIDLRYLREIMQRTDPDQGAYIVDYDNFHQVYNFVRRIVERSGREVLTVLFTLNTDNPVVEDVAEIGVAIEALEQAVFTSLRRVDVASRYSSRQFIVVLMDVSEENGSKVAQRVMDCYQRIYKGNWSFDYDIVKMEGKKILRK